MWDNKHRHKQTRRVCEAELSLQCEQPACWWAIPLKWYQENVMHRKKKKRHILSEEAVQLWVQGLPPSVLAALTHTHTHFYSAVFLFYCDMDPLALN